MNPDKWGQIEPKLEADTLESLHQALSWDLTPLRPHEWDDVWIGRWINGVELVRAYRRGVQTAEDEAKPHGGSGSTSHHPRKGRR